MCQYGFFPQKEKVEIVNLTCAWHVMDVANMQQAKNSYPFGIEYNPGLTWIPSTITHPGAVNCEIMPEQVAEPDPKGRGDNLEATR
jgi:hypothetical protein